MSMLGLRSPSSNLLYCLVCEYMGYEVESVRPRGRRKKNWRQFVEKDRWTQQLNKKSAVDCSKWRKLIKDIE